MPRVAIPATTGTTSGVNLPAETSGDPVNNHSVTNTGRTQLLVRNSGAVARTVTFLFARTVDGSTVTNKTKAIPAGETHLFGPFDRNDYGTELLVNADNAELKFRAIE